MTCSRGKMLSTALITRGYVVTRLRAVASAVENPTEPPPSPSAGRHSPFLEPIPGLPAVVENGEELAVSVSACADGDGVYCRPAWGVYESIVLDVSEKLQAMHLARKVDVEAAASAAPSGRRPLAIMSHNAAAVGARSVSILSRLCDGVMADADFQRVPAYAATGWDAHVRRRPHHERSFARHGSCEFRRWAGYGSTTMRPFILLSHCRPHFVHSPLWTAVASCCHSCCSQPAQGAVASPTTCVIHP